MANTTIAIDDQRFLIDGEPTYAGTGAEGLLFNVRTVNATFDDTLGHVDWWNDDGSRAENDHAGYGVWSSPASADENTARFVDALPAYRDAGVLAVNLNFQGGHPLQGKTWIAEGSGSAGRRPNGHRDFYHNSAFDADGAIDPNYAQRVGRVIDACDALGMVVILQLFYFGQDTVFESEAGVLAAADAGTDFVCERGDGNVIVEIANEVMQGHFHHDILKPARVAEVIRRVRDRAKAEHGRDLIVSTSEAALLNERQWREDEIDTVFEACDVAIIHGGDNVETGRVGDASELVSKVKRIRSSPWFGSRPRPILTNESHGQAAFEAMVRRGVSFGLHSNLFQTMWPPRWGVWENETSWFFESVRKATAKGSH